MIVVCDEEVFHAEELDQSVAWSIDAGTCPSLS